MYQAKPAMFVKPRTPAAAPEIDARADSTKDEIARLL